MSITASMVKELRERTGAGMMECKKALVETDGDLDAAAEFLRKSGQAKADKKASRVAADGRVVVAQDGSNVVIVEVNSETDFVAKDENFASFTEAVAAAALASGATDVDALAGEKLADGRSVEEARSFIFELRITAQVLTDPERVSYCAIGMQHSVVSSLSLRTVAHAFRAWRKGHRQGAASQDVYEAGKREVEHDIPGREVHPVQHDMHDQPGCSVEHRRRSQARCQSQPPTRMGC